MQRRFPETIWQKSNPEISPLKNISSWINYEKLNDKLPQPLNFDVNYHPWEILSNILISLQGIKSLNMIHIASWGCKESLFKECEKLLN